VEIAGKRYPIVRFHLLLPRNGQKCLPLPSGEVEPDPISRKRKQAARGPRVPRARAWRRAVPSGMQMQHVGGGVGDLRVRQGIRTPIGGLAAVSTLRSQHFAHEILEPRSSRTMQKRWRHATPSIATKIASRLARTIRQARAQESRARSAGIEVSKQQQSSDWGADALTDAQVATPPRRVAFACPEGTLDAMLAREDARTSRRPAFASCLIGSGSTSPAGQRKTFCPFLGQKKVKNVQLVTFSRYFHS